ncbi:MAG: DNA mismatch repair endonuclease MutL, partial [Bacillota bacterium]
MGHIQVLDEQTANLIAAGEVVERPASVVKELVENALDAGATRVDIEVEEGGLRLVRVVDDGSGMDREDARLCLERHATSKIRRGGDLFAIHTLGFRGEALPSIASVSRLEILTRPASQVAGTRVTAEGGRDPVLEDAGCPAGTRVTVQDLFFNTPARLKYLKSPSSETGQVSDVFTRLALSRPDVAFQLMSGGSVLSSTPGNGSMLDAVGSLYGTKLAKGLAAVRWEDGPTRVTGYIAKPEFARANRTHQHLFVNGRYIKGSSLRFPVEEAYRNLLMTGRFPVFFLSLEVDPEQVDVNVHPTKLDVRFSQEREVKAALYRAVQEALSLAALVPAVTWEEGAQDAGAAPAAGPGGGGGAAYGGGGGAPQGSDSPWSLLGMGEAAATYLAGGALAGPGQLGVLATDAAGAPGSAVAPPTVGEAVEQGAVFAPGAREGGATVHHPELLALRPLGQVLRSYIVADGPDGLYLIDQHAAHERVYFERFARERESRTVTQPLLL